MDRDLLVPPNTEGPDGVSGLGEDGGLASKGFQHLAGTGQPITRLSNTDVEAELPDSQVPHGVLSLVLATLDHPDLSEIRQEFRRLPEELEETQMGQVTRY